MVSSIEVKDAADGKRKSVDVALGVKDADAAMSLVGLTCSLADGKDANVELRSALGALVSAVVKAAPAPVLPAKKDPATAGSADASKPSSGDSSAASGDQTKKVAAQEGLDILNSAAARK